MPTRSLPERPERIPVKTAVASLLLAAVVAAGCGSGSSKSGNSTDAAFIADMTHHHQGAIDMAKVAQKRGEHPEVRKLAADIISAQQAEITVMRAIEDDLHHMGMEGGHLGMSNHAMGTDMDMGKLDIASPFDRAFIDMMVPHHEGAIRMAREELQKGAQPALRKMAGDIISTQREEIAKMKQWRKRWYGSATTPN